MTEGSSNLSHIDESGNARMVNVGSKGVTDRVAVARCELHMLQPPSILSSQVDSIKVMY
ncbi:MAG: hypothetical protein Ct9H300mP19_02610 [Dehalococcoidia bacterium]|nr:MAG: hypothetical protein Ct9H300mP19_02610 [Dehalococcoidia bacterium]